MNRAREIVRVVFLSPELLVALAVGVVWWRSPGAFENVANALSAGKGVPEFMGALPAALVVASYRLGVSILRPGDESENKILYRWPQYWALEARVYGSGFLCLICGVTYWVTYVNPFGWAAHTVGVLSVLTIALPIVSVVTLAIARLIIRKIVTLYG